jgi:hypothetical protein
MKRYVLFVLDPEDPEDSQHRASARARAIASSILQTFPDAKLAIETGNVYQKDLPKCVEGFPTLVDFHKQNVFIGTDCLEGLKKLYAHFCHHSQTNNLAKQVLPTPEQPETPAADVNPKIAESIEADKPLGSTVVSQIQDRLNCSQKDSVLATIPEADVEFDQIGLI